MSLVQIKRSACFVAFLIGAVMASAIAGLTTAILHGTGMQVVTAAATTFVAVLGMAMTAYQFVCHPTLSSSTPAQAPSPATAGVLRPPAGAGRPERRRGRRTR